MNHEPKNTLIAIVGPTASGKTAAAIALAQALDTVIVSADSRQFYREMSIGTAKPTAEEQRQARHYFINSHSVTEDFNVGQFEEQGLQLLNELFKTHNQVILVGGSGLYVKAICDGFDDLPSATPAIRERLNAQLVEKGLESLQQRLKEVDPDYYQTVDLNNPQRLVRALEVHEVSGQPFSSFRQGEPKKRPFEILKVGTDMPRDVLYNRINERVDLMVAEGLIDEVKWLLPYRHLNALNTVGYSEVFDYLDGKTDVDTAIALIKQNTRRFAKRQMTWFNRDKNVNWIAPNDIVAFVRNHLQLNR